jgi:hypothetical protein
MKQWFYLCENKAEQNSKFPNENQTIQNWNQSQHYFIARKAIIKINTKAKYYLVDSHI